MQMVDVKEDKNNIVKKHNQLIKSKNILSGTAHKMLSMVISMIRIDDAELQQYALRQEDYLKLIGSKSKDREFYITQAEELMSNPFRIDGKLFNWCSMVDYESMEGFLIFEIHKDLKPHLLDLKCNFTEYSIFNILSLRGNYSPKLYELFIMKWNEYKHYKKSAKSFTFDVTIQYLRDKLNIPDTYRYDNIKKQIITVAQKQFKEYTDIQFTYTEQKIGRKVDRLIITIKPNAKKIDKKIVSANDYPIEVMALKGTPNFSNDEDFIIAYDDGSFQLKKANGSYIYFKSLKQFIYMLHNKEF